MIKPTKKVTDRIAAAAGALILDPDPKHIYKFLKYYSEPGSAQFRKLLFDAYRSITLSKPAIKDDQLKSYITGVLTGCWMAIKAGQDAPDN